MPDIDHIAILEMLEEAETEWAEFCHKAAELIPRFKTVTDEYDLEATAQELLDVWQEYPLLRILLSEQGGNSKRPPSPTDAPKFNPKETANKYYSLLVKLNATDSPQENSNHPRTNS